MKRILIINTELPYPLTKGGRQGVFHFIDNLRNEYDISLLFKLSESEEEDFCKLKSIWNNVTLYPFVETATRTTNDKGLISKLYNYMYSIPFIMKDKIINKKTIEEDKEEKIDFVKNNSTLFVPPIPFLSEEFVNYVGKISRAGFDIIQVEFYPLLSLVHILPDNVEKIFIHHEIRYIRNQIEMSYFEKRDEFENYLCKVAKNYELTTLALYDKIITVTDIDKNKLKEELSNKQIISSPLMVTTSEDIPVNEYVFNNKLTFIGSYTHFPNVDGIKWFISQIWTEINNKNKHLELHIIGGGWKAKMFNGINLNNVFFDGYVENLSDVLLNTISIVPIRIGSGMRMKILDAINHKIPFVTTSLGVEGLDFINNKDCFIEDDPIKFAQAILKLTDDPNLQSKFIRESNQTLNQIYNKEVLLEKRRSVYRT